MVHRFGRRVSMLCLAVSSTDRGGILPYLASQLLMYNDVGNR